MYYCFDILHVMQNFGKVSNDILPLNDPLQFSMDIKSHYVANVRATDKIYHREI